MAVVCVILAASCTRARDESRDLTLHAVREFDVKTWDPALAYDETSLEVLPAIFETLYQYDYLSEKPALKPLLATELPQLSADGLELTIPVLSGVRFHSDPCFNRPDGKGREVIAQDFVFALKRLALPSLNSPGWWLLGRRIAGMAELRAELEKTPPAERWKRMEDARVSGLSTDDPHRLRIRLTKPFAPAVHLLAQTFSAPLAPECARKQADVAGAVFSTPIGTGPFRLKDWARGARIVLERNPDRRPEYYPTEASSEFMARGWLADSGKPLPLLETLVFDIFPDKGPAWGNFLKGATDVLRIPRDYLPQAITNQANLSPDLESRGIRLAVEPGSAFTFLIFNMRDPLLGKKKALRQAISSAIDRGKWIEQFTAGTGRKMQLKYDFDLARAKRLLAQAGNPGGRGLPAFTLHLRGTDGYNRQLGEFLSKQLAAIGVRVQPVLVDFAPFLETARAGKFQLAYGNWEADYPDPQNFAEMLYGPNAAPGPNLASFRDMRADALIEKGALEELQSLVQEEVPWAYGFRYSHYTVTQPWVRNFRAHGLQGGQGMFANKWKYVRIDPAAKTRYLEAAKSAR